MSVEKSPIAVIGAGGHAKVVIAALLANNLEVGDVFDDDDSKWGTSVHGFSVIGPIEAIRRTRYRRAVVALGNNQHRREVATDWDLEWQCVVHPAAWVDPTADLGAGSVVFAGAIIQADASIGRHVIVNTSSSVDHDCVLGDFVHVAPGANLAGGVRVGEGSLLGIGSCVAPGINVGPWATVGAGSTVVEDVAAAVTVVGVPARPVCDECGP